MASWVGGRVNGLYTCSDGRRGASAVLAFFAIKVVLAALIASWSMALKGVPARRRYLHPMYAVRAGLDPMVEESQTKVERREVQENFIQPHWLHVPAFSMAVTFFFRIVEVGVCHFTTNSGSPQLNEEEEELRLC